MCLLSLSDVLEIWKDVVKHFYLSRLHPEDLNQSVMLHMTEKMGYKHAEVVNTVLSNRASHTLSIYFLLNRKLDHYFKSAAVSNSNVF